MFFQFQDLALNRDNLYELASWILLVSLYEAPEEGDENYEEYKKYQSELKEVVNQIKSATKNTDFDFSSSIMFEIEHLAMSIENFNKRFIEDIRKIDINFIEE